MRTVSFSQPQVQQTLSRDFVCFTTSTEGDASAGQSIRHRPQDPAGPCIRGNGQQNVQTLFLTPDGEIFHAASGYLSPADLMSELEYARDLFLRLKDVPPDRRADLVQASHRQRLEELEFSTDEINSRGPGSRIGINLPSLLPNAGNFDAVIRGVAPAGSANRPPTVDPFAAFARTQILSDHAFCIDHPLQTVRAFDRDPTPLVGNAKSFFMSTAGGSGGR
jgi:hypothetical protein